MGWSGVELPSNLPILASMAGKPDSVWLEISLSMSVTEISCVSWLFSGTMFFPSLFVGLFVPMAGVTTWDLLPLAPFLTGTLINCYVWIGPTSLTDGLSLKLVSSWPITKITHKILKRTQFRILIWALPTYYNVRICPNSTSWEYWNVPASGPWWSFRRVKLPAMCCLTSGF